jgi:SAM-dependent methyltransferase
MRRGGGGAASQAPLAAAATPARRARVDEGAAPEEGGAARDFSRRDTWEAWYARAGRLEEADWLVEPECVAEQVERLVDRGAEVLVPGCGVSRLGPLLTERGFEHVVCGDWCAAAVRASQARHPRGVEWVQLDALRMSDVVPSASVDLVLDKGLLDAQACAGDAQALPTLLAEVRRVLCAGGLYMVVTHGRPGTRSPYFAAHEWALRETVRLPGASVEQHYFLLVLERLL